MQNPFVAMQTQPSHEPTLRQPVALHSAPLVPTALSPLSLRLSDSPRPLCPEPLPTVDTLFMEVGTTTASTTAGTPCCWSPLSAECTSLSNENEQPNQQSAHMAQRELYWKTVLRSDDACDVFETKTDMVKKEFKYSALRYHCKVVGCTQMFRHRSSRSRHQKKFHPRGSA
eukprot:TRINITY_DN4969_c0_g1_i1.p1 TRINITY_DN4969_c0_g1~~TRINITY_DN4969_c0_g1_i1.p1  ORF type:complete len:171 (-),score=21.12 TRINITY_DN4969_c0_g1_i1:174-686(-)